ncbi:hypothetical protein EVAR_101600_1 [Eumeta japonica]|uniref:Uncharacterized protein n=1 Tax=Eumeta variegata TaxID=151549 RepID=A0A4C1T4E1_EUMVA|nr:hypothetical protein EVAR_101600_1 [Eumeta japonica]
MLRLAPLWLKHSPLNNDSLADNLSASMAEWIEHLINGHEAAGSNPAASSVCLKALQFWFGLGEMQHLGVLLSGYRGLGEPRSGNGAANLQRKQGLWLCYRIALRALPEG